MKREDSEVAEVAEPVGPVEALVTSGNAGSPISGGEPESSCRAEPGPGVVLASQAGAVGDPSEDTVVGGSAVSTPVCRHLACEEHQAVREGADGAPATRCRVPGVPRMPRVLAALVVLSVVSVLGACHQGARHRTPLAGDVVSPVENALGKWPVVTGMTLNAAESASAAGMALW